MITTAAEYNKYLYAIQDGNRPVIALTVPHDETIYKIDLNTRTIESPKFLSVNRDHTSETIYFRIARYHDAVDLSTKACVIQYINANNEAGVYVVPFLDVETLAETGEMLVPWCISGGVSAAAGTVEYSVRFFEVDDDKETVIYNLNTVPAKSEILHGMDPEKSEEPYDIPAAMLEGIIDQLSVIEGYINEDKEEKRFQVYWLEMYE